MCIRDRVSTMAVEVAKYILIHPAQFTLPIRKWQRNALELETKLRQIDGIEVMPSDAPFFLVQIHCATAAELIKYLLEEHNIAVYDATAQRGVKGEMLSLIHISIAPEKTKIPHLGAK